MPIPEYCWIGTALLRGPITANESEYISMLLVFPSTRLNVGCVLFLGHSINSVLLGMKPDSSSCPPSDSLPLYLLDLSPRTNLIPSASKCSTVSSFRFAFCHELTYYLTEVQNWPRVRNDVVLRSHKIPNLLRCSPYRYH